MIYYPFKNYEEFKELFGIIEHGNGVKSRKNKILLAFYKDRNALREHIKATQKISANEWWSDCNNRARKVAANDSKHLSRWARIERRSWIDCMSRPSDGRLFPENMTRLKADIYALLQSKSEGSYELHLNDHVFGSSLYRTDDLNGLCEDGTTNAIRYYNVEKGRTFKMKAGKMLNHIFSCCPPVDAMPEQVKRWFSEEFVGEWIAYAEEQLNDEGYELHVNDNFSDIYDTDCCKGNFHSCMMDDGYWTFYRDAVRAKAAYLTNGFGEIVARCVIYTDVWDMDEEKTIRLAERQYSTDCDDNLKRMLVNALYRANEIDGHKTIGASCHDATAFVDKEGNSLASHRFSIDCTLHNGDTLSYQDSFKFFDYDEQTAYNYANGECRDLAETGGSFEYNNHVGQVYSNFFEEWYDEDDAFWVETRDDYFPLRRVVYAYMWRGGRYYEEDCFDDDCIQIGSNFYYAGEDAQYPEEFNLYCCKECGEWMTGEDGYYSDLTEEWYCCAYCLDEAETSWHKRNGEVWSEEDEEWLPKDEVILAQIYYHWTHRFSETTISKERFNELVDDGEATIYNGVAYIDSVNMEGEPAHLFTELCEAV